MEKSPGPTEGGREIKQKEGRKRPIFWGKGGIVYLGEGGFSQKTERKEKEGEEGVIGFKKKGHFFTHRGKGLMSWEEDTKKKRDFVGRMDDNGQKKNMVNNGIPGKIPGELHSIVGEEKRLCRSKGGEF